MGKNMSNWQKVKIGDFLFERKGRYKPNDEQIVNLPRIEKIDFSGNFHIGNKDSKTDMILIKDGDLVISGINVAKGAMGIYSGEDVTATIHYSSYTFDSNKINVEYFKRFLKSSEFIELLNEQVKGGIKTEIKPKHILPLEIQLPDINTQAQIVQHFENVEDDIADVTKEVLKQESLLKKLKQTILQEAIEGKLTAKYRAKNPDIGTAKKLLEQIKTEKEKLIKEKKIRPSKPLPPINEDEIPFDIPQNWEWCRLGDISFVGTGATPLTSEPKYYNGDINWITSSATGADFVTEAETKITELALKETNCQIYPIGTLVIAMYGQGKTRGQITELMIDSATNQACAAISIYLKDKALNQFIKKYFQKIYLEIRELASGGAQPNLNMQKVKDTMIALPPLEEQKEIVATIEKLFTLCNELESEINQNKTTVDNLMVTVLKESFEN
jgi:type I restriction enzyme S subunit